MQWYKTILEACDLWVLRQHCIKQFWFYPGNHVISYWFMRFNNQCMCFYLHYTQHVKFWNGGCSFTPDILLCYTLLYQVVYFLLHIGIICLVLCFFVFFFFFISMAPLKCRCRQHLHFTSISRSWHQVKLFLCRSELIQWKPAAARFSAIQ